MCNLSSKGPPVILASLDDAERYLPLHPGFTAAFDYLKRTDFSGMSAGRHEVDGDRLFVMVNRGKGRGRQAVKLEAHRRYIDIQFTLSGTDDIGWRPVSQCSQIDLPFDPEKDVALFTDPPQAWIAVPPSRFTIFYPEDAHAPMAASCELLKAVMKVAVDWR